MDVPPDRGPPQGDDGAPAPRVSIVGERAPEMLLRIVFVGGFLWMCRALAVPVALGAIAAVILHPLHARLAARSRRWRRVSPALLTTAAVLLIVGPATGIAWKTIAAANDLLSGTSLGDVTAFGERMLRRFGRAIGASGEDLEALRESAGAAASRASAAVGEAAASVATALPIYITYLFLMTLSLYYGLRDGDRFVRFLHRVFPAGPVERGELFEAMRRAIHGAVLGMLVVGGVQGGICVVALLALEVPGAVLWGVIAALFSVLPVIGTTPVTMGATIYLIVVDRPVAAGIMFATALFIGGIDNVIRPYVQGSHDRVHPFVELLAIFGGIAVLGISGIFIGPVLAAMALWGIATVRGKRAIEIVPE